MSLQNTNKISVQEFVLKNSHVCCRERPLHIHRTGCTT